jgi:hypothetical protein
MIYIALGLLLLGLFLGGAGMKRHLRTAGALWRPGAGVLALAAWVTALVLILREKWPVAIPFVLLGGWLALSARRRGGPGPSAPRGRLTMSRSDAASILGVSETASAEEVQAAYLRLMRRAHPDSGGTSGLAAQLNAARETLSKKR